MIAIKLGLPVGERPLPISDRSDLVTILSVNYDLAIIGNTRAAYTAAAATVGKRHRVALVLPPETRTPYEYLFPYGLIAAGSRVPAIPDAWAFARTIVDNLNTQNAPSLLASQGIDVIVGQPEFFGKPKFQLNVEGRSIIAKKYILATGTIPPNPEIEGLAAVGYLTASTLHTIENLPQKPQNWAIVGTEPVGVEVAQAFARLGYRVCLIVDTPQILPSEDPATAEIVQASLELAGVKIFTNTSIVKVKADNTAARPLKSIGLGSRGSSVPIERAIQVEEIFLAAPPQPLIVGMHLRTVGIDFSVEGIAVDKYLRTANRRIYACGEVCGNAVGGYNPLHVSEYEARLVVGNCLGRWQQQAADYRYLPWLVMVKPAVARVGLTAQAAREFYGDKVRILTTDWQNLPQAILSGETTGFFQLIVHRNGQLLGGTIVGGAAAEMIQSIALALRNRFSLKELINFPAISPTFSEIIVQTARGF
jgi:pyruvate/2-oxoglutarate dehydrogenase complex dihydrolipoamide dehydrogenase (E3) component